jgi:CHASE2 domain-containing sensor protein
MRLTRIRAEFLRLLPSESLRRGAAIGLAFVLITEFAIHLARDHGYLQANAEAAMDAMMQHHVGTASANRTPPAFAFIDADDETYADWGDPTEFPKEKLVPLIDYALKGGARGIVVDVDVFSHGVVPDVLRSYLAGYGQNGPAPPLVLARAYSAPRGRLDELSAGPSPAEAARSREQPVYAAAPLFLRDADGIVRQWLLWTADCHTRAHPVPSIELLLLALSSDGKPDRLENALGSAAARKCARPDLPTGGGRISFGDTVIDFEPHGLAERILFTLTPQTLDQPYVPVSGRQAPMLRQLSARIILSAAGNHTVSDDAVRGRIAVIGSSALAARDIYVTPVGEMAGALVVVNAITTLMQYGQLRAPPVWAEAALGVAIGMSVWALLEFLQFPIAALFSAVLVVCVTLIFSRFWLRSGIWLDAMAPSLGVVLHRWLVVIQGIWTKRRQLGWRVLLSGHIQQRHGASRVPDPGANTGSSDRSRTTTVLLAIVMLGGPATDAQADPPQVAARIVDMSGPVESYRIVHADGSNARAAVYADILAGDRVEALGDQVLLVELAGRSEPVVVRRGVPLVVPSPPSGISLPILGAVGKELLTWIGLQGPSLEPAAVISAMTRGDTPIRLPLFAGGARFVAAGDRALPVAWRGGEPPYSVAVLDVEGHVLAELREVGGSRVTLPTVLLRQGSYTIRVVDKQGRSVIARFEAVPGDQVPVPGPAVSSGDADAVALTAIAAWLAGQGDGEWSYEAMIRAIPFAATYPQARILAEALARGRRSFPR